MDRSLVNFVGLIFASIVAVYYMPAVITTGFLIITLVSYFRSKNEPFWLAYFLVLSDGFFGFFGTYSATLSAIPGLPGIEAAQIYIGLTILKAARVKGEHHPFFHFFLQILFFYVIFLVIQGQAYGISPQLNVQLRVVKMTLPLLLFYSIPRLMPEKIDYENSLKYLFSVAAFALFAQVFTIVFQDSPVQYFGGREEVRKKILIAIDVDEGDTYRGIYNEAILVVALFGSLVLLTIRERTIDSFYLYAAAFAVFLSYFLSATRGYVLGSLISIFLFLVFSSSVNMRNIRTLVLALFAFAIIVMSVPLVQQQMANAMERLQTIQLLLAGDVTAGGTLSRLDFRGPRIMKVWREYPVTGTGFSDDFFSHFDRHVGNQAILMHSGVIGALLLGLFLIYFNAKMALTSMSLPSWHPYKKTLMVFPAFFVGWFAIHSSTEYFFSYHPTPGFAMVQVIFFGFADKIYRSLKDVEGPEHLRTATQP